MRFKNYIQFAIVIMQIILFVSGIILTLLKVVDNMWPFTIAIYVLCFICVLIGVLK